MTTKPTTAWRALRAAIIVGIIVPAFLLGAVIAMAAF